MIPEIISTVFGLVRDAKQSADTNRRHAEILNRFSRIETKVGSLELEKSETSERQSSSAVTWEDLDMAQARAWRELQSKDYLAEIQGMSESELARLSGRLAADKQFRVNESAESRQFRIGNMNLAERELDYLDQGRPEAARWMQLLRRYEAQQRDGERGSSDCGL